ncbi:MAG: DUF4912 domain-containing protein [Planctomycetaceae bacterium]|nr:DUF4912 domain-containing protein [Planctomycetaceae bacterium]
MSTTAQELRNFTVKTLAAQAKNASIAGWHSMRKEELVTALLKLGKTFQMPEASQTAKAASSPAKSNKSTQSPQNKRNAPHYFLKTPQKKQSGNQSLLSFGTDKKKKKAKGSSPVIPSADSAEGQRMAKLKENLLKYQELSGITDVQQKDRLALIVRDSYWLHAYWELSTKTVERAKAAMGVYWHTAKPVLRLYRLHADGLAQPRREHQRDIFLHGMTNTWYIDVLDPPATFQVEIGYLAANGRFFSLVSSNFVETPESHPAGKAGSLDGNWQDVSREFERVFRLSGGLNKNSELREVFEERLKRPMAMPHFTRLNSSQKTDRSLRESLVTMDADVLIYGVTDPDVQLLIKNEPVQVTKDGTFMMKFTIPEKRHVFPVVATSGDGIESQTIILSLERNTKVLETVFREMDEDD